MSQTRPPLLAVLSVATSLFAAIAAAHAQSSDDLADGRRLFIQKGNCQACHGWAGDGRKIDNQMPDGANLRGMTIDREALIQTIKCGRPGTGMPAFDRLAYSDGRCFGLKQADLRARGLAMPDPAATLQANEVAVRVGVLSRPLVGQRS